MNQITAIDVQDHGDLRSTSSAVTGNQATTISLRDAAPIEVTLTDAAAADLVAHIQGLRALALGLPPAGVPLQGAAPPIRPPTPRSAAVGLLAGMIINHSERDIVPAAVVSRLEVVLMALMDKGVLDLAGQFVLSEEMIQALAPPLLEGMARNSPELKSVKFASDRPGGRAVGALQLSALSNVLARAWSLTKLSLKGLGITAATFDAFVQDSLINGGCSQGKIVILSRFVCCSSR